jgi:hypothetical protein
MVSVDPRQPVLLIRDRGQLNLETAPILATLNVPLSDVYPASTFISHWNDRSLPPKLNWLDGAATATLRGLRFREAVIKSSYDAIQSPQPQRGKMEAEQHCRDTRAQFL